MLKRKFWLSFVLVFVIFMISACSSSDEDNGTAPGNDKDAVEATADTENQAQEIRVRINDDPDFLDPHLQQYDFFPNDFKYV